MVDKPLQRQKQRGRPISQDQPSAKTLTNVYRVSRRSKVRWLPATSCCLYATTIHACRPIEMPRSLQPPAHCGKRRSAQRKQPSTPRPVAHAPTSQKGTLTATAPTARPLQCTPTPLSSTTRPSTSTPCGTNPPQSATPANAHLHATRCCSNATAACSGTMPHASALTAYPRYLWRKRHTLYISTRTAHV